MGETDTGGYKVKIFIILAALMAISLVAVGMDNKELPAPATTITLSPPTPVISPTPSYEHQGMIGLVNAERASRGLQPVRTNLLLVTSAHNKAQDEVNKGYWSHTSPDGSYFTDFILRTGYPYANAGEVLGRGYSDDAELIGAWMASPTHRAVLLTPEWREAGFARVGDHTVMHFGYR